MNQALTYTLILFSNFLHGQDSIQEVGTMMSADVAQSSRQDILEPRLIRIEGGSMKLGCTNERYPYFCREDEKPVHLVTVSDFHIGQFEVTNAEFCRFLNDNKDSLTLRFSDTVSHGPYFARAYWHKYYSGYNFIIEDFDRAILIPKKDEPLIFNPYPGFENHPVVLVSFLAALKYTEWLSNVSGKFFRLPTEAEWEYAARGGKLSKCHKDSCYIYAGSSTDYEVAAMTGYSEPVGTQKPNELGIFNMSGNVYEWVMDVYDEEFYNKLPTHSYNPYRGYEGSNFVGYAVRLNDKKLKTNVQNSFDIDDPIVGLPDSEYDQQGKELQRVIRGGGFINDPTSWRVSCREFSISAEHTIGFRVVKVD